MTLGELLQNTRGQDAREDALLALCRETVHMMDALVVWVGPAEFGRFQAKNPDRMLRGAAFQVMEVFSRAPSIRKDEVIHYLRSAGSAAGYPEAVGYREDLIVS